MVTSYTSGGIFSTDDHQMTGGAKTDVLKHLGNHDDTGFPCGSVGKESSCSVGDLGLITGLGRSSGEGNGYPLQY